MAKKTKIVIIGAGAAGIAAASRLLQKGVNNFIILEATNRIGGRIRTVSFADNVIDLGAQWVHGESGNMVFELASKQNLLGSFSSLLDSNRHNFITIKGEMISKEETLEALAIYNNITEQAPEGLKKQQGNFGDYFVKEYNKLYEQRPFTTRTRAAEFLSWMEKIQNSIECCDTWFDVSSKRLIEYWHCEGDSLLNWKDRGYKTLIELLTQSFPNEEDRLPVIEKIELEKVVTTIDYGGENVIVTTRDGCQYFTSHVLFTGSLGVLKDVHSKMFVPPLPLKKQSTIKELSIGTANKIFLEFPNKWWPEDIVAFNFLWSEENKNEFLQKYGQIHEWLCDVFSFFTVDYQPNVLCAWIVGQNARYMETLSDDVIFDGLCLLLKKSLAKNDFVQPKRMFRSQWYTDEHFRGSYSFQSVNSELADVSPSDLAEPIVKNGKPVILFAGEATHDHYYSTVHGAVETGFREADRLIDFDRRQLNSRL